MRRKKKNTQKIIEKKKKKSYTEQLIFNLMKIMLSKLEKEITSWYYFKIP